MKMFKRVAPFIAFAQLQLSMHPAFANDDGPLADLQEMKASLAKAEEMVVENGAIFYRISDPKLIFAIATLSVGTAGLVITRRNLLKTLTPEFRNVQMLQRDIRGYERTISRHEKAILRQNKSLEKETARLEVALKNEGIQRRLIAEIEADPRETPEKKAEYLSKATADLEKMQKKIALAQENIGALQQGVKTDAQGLEEAKTAREQSAEKLAVAKRGLKGDLSTARPPKLFFRNKIATGFLTVGLIAGTTWISQYMSASGQQEIAISHTEKEQLEKMIAEAEVSLR